MAKLERLFPFIALTVFGMSVHACMAGPKSLPTFNAVAPKHPASIEDFRKQLPEILGQQPKQDVGKALPGGGGVAALVVGAGTILDSETEELSRGLRYDPGLMYNFVHDHIQFSPIWGDVKGAAMTLLDRSGGGFDQASLTVTLLEEAASQPGAPHTVTNVRYVVGVIYLTAQQVTDWLGIPDDYIVAAYVLGMAGIPATISANPDGTINHVEMAHAWVKATIDGQIHEFDPSFKSHTLNVGLTESQLESAMGYSQSTLLTSAQQGATIGPDYVKDVNRVNVTDNLTDYSTNLINYIRTNYPAGDIADIVGGKTIIPSLDGALPPTIPPYTVVSRDYEFAKGAIPAGFKTWLRITHGGIDGWFSSSAIYGRRLVIKYNAFNQTQILLDGTVLATGNVMIPGQYYPLTLTIDHPYNGDNGTYADAYVVRGIQAGGIYNVVNGWADVGSQVIGLHRRILQQNRHAGSPDSSEEVLGESLAAMGYTFVAEFCRTVTLVGQIGDCTIINHHCVGITGQYQTPYIDMFLVFESTAAHDHTPETGMAAFLTLGGQGSAYEYGVFHQLQDYGAVSAVKLLNIANDRDANDLIFEATAANWAQIEPQLVGYDASEKDSVYSYVQAGYTVDLPQYGDLGEGDWQGIGYVALDVDDPNAYAAGYIISGGYSGGYSDGMDDFMDPDAMLRRIMERWLKNGPSSSHPQSSEPIDLLTGAYVYERTDLSIGNGDLPFGLSFARQYNSLEDLEDGPLGLGWTHRLDITAKTGSDSFQAMGDDSPVDAAGNIVALYISFDLFRSPSLVHNMVGWLSQKWLMDQMIDNTVAIKQGQDGAQFVRLPDGSFNAPPGTAMRLVKEGDGTFLLKDTTGRFLDFDPNGRAVQWSDHYGNVVDFSYTSGKLSSVVSRIGGSVASRSLSFTYDANHIGVVTDSAERSISFGYDSAGNLTSYTDPETYVTTYEYDPLNDGRMTKIFYPTAPASPFVTNEYDSLGRVKRQINATNDPNNAYDYCYAYYRTEELEPAQTPPSGPATRYSKVYRFDDHGRTVAVRNQLGHQMDMEYDGHQRLTKVIFHSGNREEYAYDTNHNVRQITRVPAPNHSDPSLVESNVYTSHENAAGRWFTDLVRHTDTAGNTTTYTYDYNDVLLYGTDIGNLQKITYPQVPDANGIPGTPIVEFTYNTYGQVLTGTDPEGIVTAHEYYTAAEGAGLKKRVIDPNGLNIATEIAYDAAGNVISSKSPNGDITTHQYYPSRWLKATIAPVPFSYATTYEYYPDGKLKHVKQSPSILPPGSGNHFESDPNCVALWNPTDYIRAHEDTIGNNDWVISPQVWTTNKKEGDACLRIRGDIGTYGTGLVGRMEKPDADCSANTPGKSGTSNSTFSWCAWVYFDDLAPGVVDVTLAGKRATGNGKNSWQIIQEYAYIVNSWKQIVGFCIGYSGGSSWEYIRHETAVVTGRWYYVGITYNGEDKGYRIRIWDDTAGATLGTDKTGTATNAMNIGDGQLIVGSIPGWYPFRGLIDSMLLFDDVLTATEIDQCRLGAYNYAADSHCVSHWGFDAANFAEDDKGTNDFTKSTGILLDKAHYKTGTEAMRLGLSESWAARTIADTSLDAGFPLKTGDTTKKISVCYWMRASTVAPPVSILSKEDVGKYSYSSGLGLFTAKPRMRIGCDSGNSWESKEATGPTILINRWYHVAMTYDDTGKSYRIRVWDEDAAMVYDTTGTAVNNINVEDGILMLVTGSFEGVIDELAVFNDILTADEIDQVRQGTYLQVPPGVYLKSYTYNALGDKATERGPYPEGATPEELQVNYTQYTYDALSRPWKVTDAENHVTETRYFPDWQVWRVIDAEDHNSVTNTYNPDGTLASVADAKGNLTQYEYDGHLRLWKTTYADSTYEQLTYDNAGRLQQKRMRAGQNITFAYDALNRVTERTLPTKSISYVYDLASRLVDANDSVAGVMHNAYDNAGRLLSVTYPDSRVVSYQYDLASNRTKLTYPDDSYITYEYDQLGRLTKVRDDANTVLAQYSYDFRSRRTGLDYANGTSVGYTYDVASRLLDVNNVASTGQLKYAYTHDYVGNRMSMSVTDSSGTKTHVYGYDNIYQLTDVNYPPGYEYLATDTTFNYDPAGNRFTVVDGSGTATYTTNNLNQYTAVAAVNYDYDDNGNLTNDGVNTYGYDAENRLLTVTKIPEPLAAACDNTDLAFTTGGSANWFAQTSQSYYGGDAAQSGGIGHSQETWLQTSVSGAGTLVFWWKVSSQGNKDWLEFWLDDVRQGRISGTVGWQQKSYPITGAGSHTLRWRYVKDGSKVAGSDCGWVDYVQWSGSYPNPTWDAITYTYDASGRRVTKVVDGQTTTKYVYDGDHCIAEYDGAGSLLRKYIYGPGVDQPICMIDVSDANATYYYHFDGLGSVIALTNSSGSTVQFYEYSVYGQVAASDPNHSNRFLFTAREFDKDTGLYYYRARYYNPEIGRFLQTDPIGYADGMNWYLYCANNPTALLDPSGLCIEGLGFQWWTAFSDVSGLTNGYGRAVVGTIAGIPGGVGAALVGFKDTVTRIFVDPIGLVGDAYNNAREFLHSPGQAVESSFIDPLLSMDPAVAGHRIGELAGDAAISAVGGRLAGKTRSGIRAYEVDTADALRARSILGDGLDIHHVGQGHLMEQLIPGYNRRTAPAIAVPEGLHDPIPNLSGTTTLTPREILAGDVRNLRNYTEAPNSSLKQLIDLNKQMYPGAFGR